MVCPVDERTKFDHAALRVGSFAEAFEGAYKDNQKLGFKRTHFPWLYEVPAEFKGKIKLPHVVLDLYPRVEALSTQKGGSVSSTEARHKGKLNGDLLCLFNWDRIYLVSCPVNNWH